jgi:hypothetical protein
VFHSALLGISFPGPDDKPDELYPKHSGKIEKNRNNDAAAADQIVTEILVK